ncbi:GSCFA domain-containing protein [Bacteroidaceae bacterium HV4-6-C5C]|jgi:GSCFA family.|nr:GSCFA domain-containing protein [Bacteroidaceae bacterium HV4-6-C5C]
MNLTTPVEFPVAFSRMTHADELLLMGSCFATHIGRLLNDAKFRCDVNPYGVLYNPASISTALREIMAGKTYSKDDLFFYGDCWHSAMHHGDFSSSGIEETLFRINDRINQAHQRVDSLHYLLITFGTAWVYEQKDNGNIASNCHKQPETLFTRRKLSVEEIVEDYTSLIAELKLINPSLKLLFTVSPIRHVRDGMHQNQLSKSTLLLAIDTLQEKFSENISYFPAYEIVLDELRDYRFYAEDMVHPSNFAVKYVWEKFIEYCIATESLEIMNESENIRKALQHKPFHPESFQYKSFLGQIVLKIDRLNKKYPYLDFQNEREICLIRLNQFPKG